LEVYSGLLPNSNKVELSAANLLQLVNPFQVSGKKHHCFKIVPDNFAEPLFGSNPPGGDCKSVVLMFITT